MYVCMYACMHVCMYACMHLCMYARMYACMHVCMYVCMYACMYAYGHFELIVVAFATLVELNVHILTRLISQIYQVSQSCEKCSFL